MMQQGINIDQSIQAICQQAPTPCYVIDLEILQKNVVVLDQIQQRTGAKILLALKGYAAHATFTWLQPKLQGVCASSLHEAILGRECFNKEVHAYAPAYKTEEIALLLPIADHILFNRYEQWQRFAKQIHASTHKPSIGIRINPEHSEVTTRIYDPCAPGSRLGTTPEQLFQHDLAGIDGLHFHTLCGSNADALERTLAVLEKKCGHYLYQMQWLNFGGGHHITRADYDIELLCQLITYFQETYQLQIYLEPGEAVALNAGYLITSVLDTFEHHGNIAIVDASASAHMPDVMEMPYRPEIYGAGQRNEKVYGYQLGGQTCLAGDVIGDYSFDAPLIPGQKLALMDMAHYSMVKNNTFNGINLPCIAVYEAKTNKLKVIKKFGYQDYKNRLS